MACTEIDNIIDKFNTFTEKPVKFLTTQKEIKDDIKNLVKSLYDYTKAQEKSERKKKKGALSELIVEDFDEEQIWQQIELQNSENWDQLVWEVANCVSASNNLTFPVKTSEDQESEKNEAEDEVSMSDEEELMSDNENLHSETETTERKKTKAVTKKSKSKPSIVDDKFFKLNEMEQFLLKEEKNEGKAAASDSDNESVDYFEDIDDDEEEETERDVMYSDFFDQADGQANEEDTHDENGDISNEEGMSDEEFKEPEKEKTKKVRFEQPSSDDESEGSDNEINLNNNVSDGIKSEFELRQQRLKQQIERLEERTLKEAPWQLKGEVDANKRPQNSLLQEVVDFDLTSRPAPIITEQTTVTLEDLIKQRIKDKAWDDVEKKEKPVDDQLAFRKKEVLDHAKSKLSLAQVYEAEYLKQKQALSGEVEEEKEPESHKEVREAMTQLFSKLDALCHYHYTPKAAQAEVKIVTNTPAISMEEVAPVATSDAALLAPEEVKKKHRGEFMSKEERTKTDKNRERRKKKKLQREKGKTVNVTEHRNTKKGTEATDKSVKTSKAFFQQLNDDSNSLIKKKNKGNVKRQ
ncbi:U3 small nucleolar ribonucleoprotein protein MPP10 [Manduca sexta]|uniref:U3 small nucleolar ribonucleoprotein protein MPP10 n=1 Tax=Manduca sexta TaxID=7130 RepID=A0A921ZLE7_MANSE|nr:U3 small nucleolar ribonucleoprotein protein MPP10 [Manduca sexta]KAG6459701.1 hypothetical protein O3G_MSEX011536 [Manduca sexta]